MVAIIGGIAGALVLIVVGVFVIGGMNRTEVPALSGLGLDAATTALTDAGLELGATTEVFDSDVPEGQVISQTPIAGETLDKGTPVALVVSKGVELVTVELKFDLMDTVLELDFADCDFSKIVLTGAYPAPELVDGNGEVLARLSGDWEPDPGNNTYFPCVYVGTFNNVPADRDEYRVNLDPDDAEDNRTRSYSRSQLESSNWVIEAG